VVSGEEIQLRLPETKTDLCRPFGEGMQYGFFHPFLVAERIAPVNVFLVQ
jgi:hypothetical protein